MSLALHSDPALDQLAINTIRFLSVDAINQANSGHPGLPLGMADVGYILWTRFMRFDPTDPNWSGRDRFVLSAGHGSMLLYSLLHLTGHDLPLEELRRFRQLHSRTPGHPEYGLTPGVDPEATPACVNSCIAGALAFGDRDDPQSNVSALLGETEHFRMHEELGTDPGMYYLWDSKDAETP